jgi:hypothetical protein
MDEENVVVNEVEVSADVATDEGQIEESKVENQEAQEEIAEPEDDTPFPKKAVNAISRREKKIEKLRAELEQVKAQLQQTTPKEQVSPVKEPDVQKKDTAPNPDDFESWDDYLQAKVEYGVAKALEAKTSQEKQSESFRKEKEYYDQRVKEFNFKEDEYYEKISDFEVMSKRFEKDFAENLSLDVRRAIMDSEDGPLALYTLMKEGRIDELEDMDGRQALKFLAKAEVRGQKYIENTKKVSSAPRPIQSVKGTGTYQKDIMDMTPDEIVNKYRNY